MDSCPHCQCKEVIKRGFFSVRGPTNHKRVQRYGCKACGRRFSDQTTEATCWQKKSYINQQVFRLLVQGMSQRSCAFVLHIHRDTVAHRITCFGGLARLHLAESFAENPAGSAIQFDEMETFEHTKCKPLSIAIAVEEGTRRILDVQVASMPAKGPLAEIARKKYGKRRDDRPQALEAMGRTLLSVCPKITRILSDKCPRYPAFTRRFFPDAVHSVTKGRRGCVVGQGELKRGGFDPLFSLNHTCAMFRDHLKRLSRRTWCTTKRASCLQNLLYVYAWFHNEMVAGRGPLVRI